jgi:hypothetical protein
MPLDLLIPKEDGDFVNSFLFFSALLLFYLQNTMNWKRIVIVMGCLIFNKHRCQLHFAFTYFLAMLFRFSQNYLVTNLKDLIFFKFHRKA